MQKICIYPGFNDRIMQALEQKVLSMSSECKLCMIAMDEMPIKESLIYNVERDQVEGYEDLTAWVGPSTSPIMPIVFLVRGLRTKWKQPVGYFLSSGPLSGDIMKTLLLECIQKLSAIGLSVKLVVGDQGSNNNYVSNVVRSNQRKAVVRRLCFVWNKSLCHVRPSSPC